VRAVLLITVGCGRIGFAARGDAGVDVLGPCLQWSAFGVPTRVAELSSGFDDWDPAITPDGTLAFTSDWTNAEGFSVAQHDRTATDQPFSIAQRLALQTSTNNWILEPSISADGNTLYFTYEIVPTSNNIGFAQRTGPTTFGPAQVIPELQNANFNHEPWISRDDLRLYYATNNLPPDMTGNTQLVVAERATVTGTFGPPQLLAGVQSPSNDSGPGMSQDELEMFFASDRPGGFGGYDIYRATRTDRTAAFGTVQAVPELDSPMDEVGPELSADGTTLYFNYNTVRNGGSNADVWTATRTCLAR
jgi:Tol biopolymer transport system component